MWPPKIPKCPKPLEEFFRELIARVTASWPIDGKGIVCADGTGGRSINLKGVSGSGGGSGTAQLQVYNASSGSTPKISVTPGQISNGAASVPRIGGIAIDIIPAPTLTVAGSDVLIYSRLLLDAVTGQAAAAGDLTILVGTALPANSATLAHLSLASIVVTTGSNAGVAVTPLVAGSLSHERCPQYFSFPLTYSHNYASI